MFTRHARHADLSPSLTPQPSSHGIRSTAWCGFDVRPDCVHCRNYFVYYFFFFFSSVFFYIHLDDAPPSRPRATDEKQTVRGRVIVIICYHDVLMIAPAGNRRVPSGRGRGDVRTDPFRRGVSRHNYTSNTRSTVGVGRLRRARLIAGITRRDGGENA